MSTTSSEYGVTDASDAEHTQRHGRATTASPTTSEPVYLGTIMSSSCQVTPSPIEPPLSLAQATPSENGTPFSTTQSLYTPSASSPSQSTPERVSPHVQSPNHANNGAGSMLRRAVSRHQRSLGPRPYVPRQVRAARSLFRDQETRLVPAKWPNRVVYLHASFNPLGIIFPSVPPLTSCGCRTPCLVGWCASSLADMFCTRNSCPFGANCGNSVRESEQLTLMKNERSGEYAVMAAEPIGRGVSLGPYVGELEPVHADPRRRSRNTGFMLVMQERPERPTQNIRIGINASRFGGILRFANHSCEPNAEFRAVASGRNHTVIAVTIREVAAGEEIKINYGDDLWFTCRCGVPTCIHGDAEIE